MRPNTASVFKLLSSNCMSMLHFIYTEYISLLAPRVIIYGNACNLHSYCLNRDPDYFRETVFLVDRFHWKNHKGIIVK